MALSNETLAAIAHHQKQYNNNAIIGKQCILFYCTIKDKLK